MTTTIANDAFVMVERTAPKFVKFEVGENVTGILARIDRIKNKDTGKQMTRYTVQDPETGEQSCFLGCYQIDSALTVGDRGRIISITLKGIDKTVVRNGNAMKDFKIQVSNQVVDSELRRTQLEITDDDISF